MANEQKGQNFLKRVLEAAQGFDDKYSEKIRDMYKGANPAVQAMAYTVGGGHPSLRKGQVEAGDNPRLAEGLNYALPAVNAIPKYVLPGAGVTMAGAALIDLANKVNSQLGDRQEGGQLQL